MKKSLVIPMLLATPCAAQSFTESFGNIPALSAGGGWISVNKSQPPNKNTWNTDPRNFTGTCMAAGWYCTDTVNTGDASVWLFTPPVWLHNGDSLSFYTISYNNIEYPDRMEVRLNTTGTDTFVGAGPKAVGHFTHLALTINPELDKKGYPMDWTKYAIALDGLAVGGVWGRMVFRYTVPHTGGQGTQGSVVAIDDLRFRSVLDGAFSICSNTVSQEITIGSSLPMRSIILKHITGATCRKWAGSETNVCKWKVDDLGPGIYLVEARTPEGHFVQKWVKTE